uniref:Uncharacterized protein n=1 Tax=Solanum tuberosum TaxID=4113 RepID=M1BTK0_SOLTU
MKTCCVLGLGLGRLFLLLFFRLDEFSENELTRVPTDYPVDLLSSRIDIHPVGYPLSSGAAKVGRFVSFYLVEIADELGDPPFGQLIAFSVLPLASSYSGSLGGTVLLRGTDR